MLKGKNMTGNAKRSSDDFGPSAHSKRQRTELPSLDASSPGNSHSASLTLSHGRSEKPEDVLQVETPGLSCTPRRKLRPARRSLLSTPITRWLIPVPGSAQNSPRSSQEDLPKTPASSTTKKRQRQRRRKSAVNREEGSKITPEDSQYSSTPSASSGHLQNNFSRKKQVKKTFNRKQDCSSSVYDKGTSNEPAPSPHESQHSSTACDGVKAKK